MKNVVDFKNKKFDVSAYEDVHGKIGLDSIKNEYKVGFYRLFRNEELMNDSLFCDMIENLFNRKIKMIYIKLMDNMDGEIICSAVIRNPIITIQASGDITFFKISEYVEEFKGRNVRYCNNLINRINVSESRNFLHDRYHAKWEENTGNKFDITVLYEDGKEEE